MTIDIVKGRYWNEGITLVEGCTPCSPGCDHCWSAAQTHRFMRNRYFTYDSGQFNGDIQIHPERLKRFNTHKPKVFSVWNDLFHENVPPQFLDDVFAAMRFNGASHNTFLVLTKRPQNISAKYFEIMQHSYDNLYIGLTVCNQQEADEKIPIFLQVPGKKFLSIEPFISAINIMAYLFGSQKAGESEQDDKIQSVILGGETGPGARPMNPDWVRSVRDQCAAASVPFFFKGWGAWKGAKDFIGDKAVPMSERIGRFLDGRTHDELPWVNT